jgi:hypothetical protein
MSKKSLPLTEPPIIGYLHHAYTLSITGNCHNFDDWFNSGYVQLYGDNLSGGINFFDHDFTHMPQPLLSSHSMCIDAFVKGKYDIIDFIIHCLDTNYYVYTFVDESFIPGKEAYSLKQRFAHEILICGYDLDTRQFDSVGFSDSFQYGKSKINFEDLANAFNNLIITSKHMNNIHLLQPKHDIEYAFNLGLVRELLDDYYTSRNTSEKYSMIRPPCQRVFGMELYDFLIDDFEQVINGKTEIKINSLHILWEHKKCMLNRTLYMQQKYKLLEEFNVAPLKEIERIAYKARDELIVFSMSNDFKCFHNIIKYLGQMKEKEQVALRVLIDRM